MDGCERAEARDSVQPVRHRVRFRRPRRGFLCRGSFGGDANPSLVMRSQLCFFSLIRELADEREQGCGVTLEDAQREVVVRAHRRRAPLELHADRLHDRERVRDR